MKNNRLMIVVLATLYVLLFKISPITLAQTDQSSTGPPPIEQQLVRVGDLAIKLVFALGMGVVNDENEAGRRLAQIGIAPPGGWIADYPVTPDIAGELRHAVVTAADAGKLSMDRKRALQEFDDVLAGLGLPLFPDTGETADNSAPLPTESYVAPEVVNNYYYAQGPPVVTYYPPPPTYTHLYSWVPCRFRTTGYRFPGFFVLHDFHKKAVVHKRSFFVSKHFNHSRTNRDFRIDPRTRFKEHSFTHRHRHDAKAFSFGGFQPNDRKFTDRHRTKSLHRGKKFDPHTQTSRVFGRPAKEINAEKWRHVDRARTFNRSSQDNRSFKRHSRGSGSDSSHFRRGGNSGHHSKSGKVFNRSSARGDSPAFRADGGRNFSPASRGGRFSHGGRGRR